MAIKNPKFGAVLREIDELRVKCLGRNNKVVSFNIVFVIKVRYVVR